MKKLLWTKPSLSRDFTLLAGLIIFILVLVSLWVAYETYEAHSEKVIKQLETEAARIDRAMIIEVEHGAYLVESLARQINQYGVDDLSTIAQLLKSFDVNAIAHNVFSWIDANQMLVVSSNRGVLAKPIDVSDRDYMKKTLSEAWKIQIGRPIEGRVSNKWVLPIAIGITDYSGKYLGTLLLSLDIDALTKEMQSVIRKSGINFAVFSRTLIMLTENNDTLRFASDDFYLNALRRIDFEDKPAGVLSMGSFFSSDRVYSYYEVSANYPYIIVLGFDSKASMTTIRGLLLPKLLQLSLMAVFMLSLLWIIRVRIIRPVLELTGIAAQVAQGKRYEPLHGSGPHEVEMLSDEVHKLSRYIGEQRRIAGEQEHKNLMLKRAKESAELSNRIKVEFIAAMSHELRTPLNTITGFAEIMNNELYGPMPNAHYQQYVRDMHDASKQAQLLVEDVMALSSAEAGILELQEKPVDVRFVMNKCVRILAEKLQQLQINVEVKTQEHLPRLMVDELRLKQIIINLLANAAKHTQPGGHILIDARLEKDKKQNDEFVISFTDFGTKAMGKEPNTLEMSDTQAAQEGVRRRVDITSLSLPLTKALVAMHQAVLDISSPPGKATTVTVRFPKERVVD